VSIIRSVSEVIRCFHLYFDTEEQSCVLVGAVEDRVRSILIVMDKARFFAPIATICIVFVAILTEYSVFCARCAP
jgi:ABC-type arginine transport system permease subunit